MTKISLVESYKNVDLFLMENESLKVYLTNFGASIFAVQQKQNDGVCIDLVLTSDSLDEFIKNGAYFGATVGRTTNRIKNGSFRLNSKEYQLPQNDGNNSSHGGNIGFSHRSWKTNIKNDLICFTLHSPDGEEGYPGNLEATVTYGFDRDGRIEITYTAISDQDTLLSFTNHTYWCIGGVGHKIYSQELEILGDHYLEVDRELIPTGQILDVKNTPYDFTLPTFVGKNLSVCHPALLNTRGYDVSYVRKNRESGLAAILRDRQSKRQLEVFTTMPIIHLYTGNYLQGFSEKRKSYYQPHDALCLEASYYPDAIHHSHFGFAVLKANCLRTDKIWYRIT